MSDQDWLPDLKSLQNKRQDIQGLDMHIVDIVRVGSDGREAISSARVDQDGPTGLCAKPSRKSTPKRRTTEPFVQEDKRWLLPIGAIVPVVFQLDPCLSTDLIRVEFTEIKQTNPAWFEFIHCLWDRCVGIGTHEINRRPGA